MQIGRELRLPRRSHLNGRLDAELAAEWKVTTSVARAICVRPRRRETVRLYQQALPRGP